MVHEGEIPAYQVGDKWLRVRWVEVVRWIRSQRVVPKNAAQAERVRRRVDEILERERNTVWHPCPHCSRELRTERGLERHIAIKHLDAAP